LCGRRRDIFESKEEMAKTGTEEQQQQEQQVSSRHGKVLFRVAAAVPGACCFGVWSPFAEVAGLGSFHHAPSTAYSFLRFSGERVLS
jgi:hypothetical protein